MRGRRWSRWWIWRKWRGECVRCIFWSGWSSLYIGRGTNQFHNRFESSQTAFEHFSFSTATTFFNLRKTRHSRGGTTSPLQPHFRKTSARAETPSQLPKDQVRWSRTCTCNGNISVLDFAKISLHIKSIYIWF